MPGKPVPVSFQDFLPETQQIGRGVVIGQAGAEGKLEGNKQTFLNDFVNRADFLARYPRTLSPAQFVDSLNANAGDKVLGYLARKSARLTKSLRNVCLFPSNFPSAPSLPR